MKELTVIFKPTNACNLNCSYCYAYNMRKQSIPSMSIEEAYAAFDWLLKYCKSFNIDDVIVLWHGGEPLLCGEVFMTRVINYYMQLFSDNGIHVTNKIQTNLTLLNSGIVELVKEYFDSKIGFSFDYKSPTRCYPDGRDAGPDILDRIHFARENDLDIRAISLLTQYNCNLMEELYNFFKSENISFKLNRIFRTENPSELALQCAYTISDEQYIDALCKLVDLWLNDSSPTIKIANISNMIIAFLQNRGVECTGQKDCGKTFIGISAGGMIVPCGRFDSVDDCLGSFYMDSPELIKQRRDEMAQTDVSMKKLGCENCKYIRMCYGGCCHARRTGWQIHDCNTSKAIWAHIEKQLSKFGLSQGCLEHISYEQAEQLLTLHPNKAVES